MLKPLPIWGTYVGQYNFVCLCERSLPPVSLASGQITPSWNAPVRAAVCGRILLGMSTPDVSIPQYSTSFVLDGPTHPSAFSEHILSKTFDDSLA
jgi:hypothetical protein